MNKQASQKVYAQFGAGHHGPVEWLNFDASYTLRLERLPVLGSLVRKNSQRFPQTVRFGDIVAGLPLAAGSCAGLYGSHVLEHLSYRELRQALRNCHHLLEAGGLLRVIVPDLENLARKYLNDSSASAASIFMKDSMLGIEAKRRGVRGRLIDSLGRSQHLWMWDEKGLTHELAEAGFNEIRRCAFGDARDPMFQFVEDPIRFTDALALEAVK